MFVYDSSGSVTSPNFDKMRALGKSIIGRMQMGDDAIRAGIVTFANSPVLQQGLTSSGATLNSTFTNMGYSGGGTGLLSGLRVAMNEIATNGRTDAAKVIYVLTDGLANARKYYSIENPMTLFSLLMFSMSNLVEYYTKYLQILHPTNGH